MPPVRSSPLLYSKATQPRQVTITEKPAVVALLHSKSPTTASLLFVSNVKTEQNKNPLKLFVVFIKLKSKGLHDFYYLASLKKKQTNMKTTITANFKAQHPSRARKPSSSKHLEFKNKTKPNSLFYPWEN